MNIYEFVINKQNENNILNEVISILNEERGISDVVSNLTFEIKNEIIKNINNSKSLPFNYDQVTYKKGELNEFTFNNVKIIVKWQYYSFASIDILNRFPSSKLPISYCKKITNNYYELNLCIAAINGQFQIVRILETIQHELEHIWETSNKGTSYKNMDLYIYGKTLMNNPNEYKRSVGIILYLSQNWEQRAFSNGVYQYLINHKYPENSFINIKETQLYGGLIQLKQSIKILKEITDPYQHPFIHTELNQLKNNFNITFDKLIQIGEKAINNIIRILGRTLSKVEDDLEKKEKGEILFPNYNFIK